MKLNKYLLMATMGLGLIACTENDLVEGGDSNGVTERRYYVCGIYH